MRRETGWDVIYRDKIPKQELEYLLQQHQNDAENISMASLYKDYLQIRELFYMQKKKELGLCIQFSDNVSLAYPRALGLSPTTPERKEKK